MGNGLKKGSTFSLFTLKTSLLFRKASSYTPVVLCLYLKILFCKEDRFCNVNGEMLLCWFRFALGHLSSTRERFWEDTLFVLRSWYILILLDNHSYFCKCFFSGYRPITDLSHTPKQVSIFCFGTKIATVFWNRVQTLSNRYAWECFVKLLSGLKTKFVHDCKFHRTHSTFLEWDTSYVELDSLMAFHGTFYLESRD